MDYVVYDVEAQLLAEQVPDGWDNPYGMGMSVGCAWWSKTNKFYFFGDRPEDREDMCEFLHGKTCVTFNGISYDSKVLLGNDRVIGSDNSTSNAKYGWMNKDIYLSMWRKVLAHPGGAQQLLDDLSRAKNIPSGVFNLDAILQATLKTKKNSNGVEAVHYYQNGHISKLHEYVLQDVICERDLYQFIKKFGYLITGNYDIVSFIK
jgi:hypothetical protein